MRKIKIVADSSADLLQLEGMDFAVAPLKIIADGKEFVDDANLDPAEMVTWFDSYKGKSKTSCPNPQDWIDAFEGYQEVYCVTITSGLSGSYNSAVAAKQMYEADDPNAKVYVLDSLSAGPELVLHLEELARCIREDMPFQKICEHMEAYKKTCGLVFMLGSLKNFAANGRVSPAVAKIAGVLNIRIVGKASDEGTLEPLHKCRGETKSLAAMLEHMLAEGLRKGKVRIAHCLNAPAAQALKEKILAAAPHVQVTVHKLRGLCSYYAEKGGLLVGFEKC
jgi:DegV family protein with EDD domain